MGTITGNFAVGSSNKYVSCTLWWSSQTDNSNNRSWVAFDLRASRTNSGYTTYGTGSGTCNINGTEFHFNISPSQKITQNSNTQLASGGLWVAHNVDGSKTCYIGVAASIPGAHLTLGETRTNITLENIPRAATLTSAPNFNDMDSPTITFSNPGGFPIYAWLEQDTGGVRRCQRNLSNTGTYTWTFSEEEKKELRNICTGSSLSLWFGLGTNIGGKEEVSWLKRVFTVKESELTRPSVAMNLSLDNGKIPEKFDGMCIQGKTLLNVTIEAEGKYNASISSYSAMVDGISYSTKEFLANAFTHSGNQEVVCYAKDSRGITGSASEQVEVIPYSRPTIRPVGNDAYISCYRGEGQGARKNNSDRVWLSAEVVFSEILSAGENINLCRLQWRSKSAEQEWDDNVHEWKVLELKDTPRGLSYSGLLKDAFFDMKKAYTIQLQALDDVEEYDIKEFAIPTQDVAFHMARGGKNVGIGRYADTDTEHTVSVGWDAYFDKGMFFERDKVYLNIFDIIYPVGSIYMSANDTDPAELFGVGTWEAIHDRFLVSAGEQFEAETTGGKSIYTLRAAIGAVNGNPGTLGYIAANASALESSEKPTYVVTGNCYTGENSYWNHSTPVTDLNGDGTRNTEILPPYMAVYMWKRIS
jgi:hypothetical protein